MFEVESNMDFYGNTIRQKKEKITDSNIKWKHKKEVLFTIVGLCVSIIASFVLALNTSKLFSKGGMQSDVLLSVENIGLLFILVSLVYGNLLYHIIRIVFLCRLQQRKFIAQDDPCIDLPMKTSTLTLLVPFKEEDIRNIKQTILSVALQPYLSKKIILLTEDSYSLKYSHEQGNLIVARHLETEIKDMLHQTAQLFEQSLDDFMCRVQDGKFNAFAESLYLSKLFMDAHIWFLQEGDNMYVVDQPDVLFRSRVFYEPAKEYFRKHQEIESDILSGHLMENVDDFCREHKHLCEMFHVEITTLEKRQHEDFLREPSKAITCSNSLDYIGVSPQEAKELLN